MPVGPQETVLAPIGSRILCVGILVIALVVGGALVVRGDAGLLARTLPALAFAAAGAIIVFWIPRVRVSPAEIEVVNPFRTYRVSWPAVREVGTRWAMTLYTDAGRIEAWAAPAPGPLTGGTTLERTDRRGRPSRFPGAAQIVRRQWEAYRDAGALGAVEGDGATRTWHPVRIALLAALGALTVVAVLLS